MKFWFYAKFMIKLKTEYFTLGRVLIDNTNRRLRLSDSTFQRSKIRAILIGLEILRY